MICNGILTTKRRFGNGLKVVDSFEGFGSLINTVSLILLFIITYT